MKLFDVYPLFDIEPVRGEGVYVWDKNGTKYLDLYGGHAVISIGHSHPHFVARINRQLNQLAFYSNSIINPLQSELAALLGEISGLNDYQLFLCNSGAEANENALKLASFVTGRKKIISFRNGFHGRTSLAVAVTDNPKIQAPVNKTDDAIILPLNDIEVLEKAFAKNEISSVILEGIQGIGGINMPDQEFVDTIVALCKKHGALFIADAVQCGYGRSGKFFSHDYFGVKADIYTMAKGMGNGFPVAGIAIAPHIEPKYGMLGTTYGGNHLACAAAIAVLEVMKGESLIENAAEKEAVFRNALEGVEGLKEVRGRGLMLGLEFEFPIKELRLNLLNQQNIFTGSATDPNVMRLLPPLTIGLKEIETFKQALNQTLTNMA
ncbi:aminotransferase class III-fold pyridoxal phosphate-dependent enzyme [Flammeovirgaceae bacterium SG7u.111]|nr:aminotransferase class III-fold pyridoxal phosphate-dependent enzyme [Flammeovirgaceae bacterium SG7u.132]WPO38572.1 aminotransferase class III-fold pyridoxal phosphate-dependent enzyme [Flammeovirgaceae bacterium SG7u.111]